MPLFFWEITLGGLAGTGLSAGWATRARAEMTCTFGRLHVLEAELLGLVVFSVYFFVLAPCLAAVRLAPV